MSKSNAVKKSDTTTPAPAPMLAGYGFMARYLEAQQRSAAGGELINFPRVATTRPLDPVLESVYAQIVKRYPVVPEAVLRSILEAIPADTIKARVTEWVGEHADKLAPLKALMEQYAPFLIGLATSVAIQPPMAAPAAPAAVTPSYDLSLYYSSAKLLGKTEALGGSVREPGMADAMANESVEDFAIMLPGMDDTNTPYLNLTCGAFGAIIMYPDADNNWIGVLPNAMTQEARKQLAASGAHWTMADAESAIKLMAGLTPEHPNVAVYFKSAEVIEAATPIAKLEVTETVTETKVEIKATGTEADAGSESDAPLTAAEKRALKARNTAAAKTTATQS